MSAAPERPAPDAAAPLRPLDLRPTEEDVRAAYRLILGREPENDEVVGRHVAKVPSVAQLRLNFIRSEEFRARSMPALLPPMPLAPPPPEIEAEAGEAKLGRMLARIGAYWEAIGGEAPHWSVLTQPRFRPESIAAHREAFYATGEEDVALLLGLLARHGMNPAELPRVMEFGCGVGRVTLALSRAFRAVLACDISSTHLAEAEREARARGLPNIVFRRSTLDQPMPRGGCDVWFSRLVLQHNPPPVILWLLRTALHNLAPGGAAVFQLLTHRAGYRFAVAEWLAKGGEKAMETHVLPQHLVFALAAELGLDVLEVREDTNAVAADPSVCVSNLFVLRRPRR